MDTSDKISFFVYFGYPILIFVVAYFVGRWIENRHFTDIRKRESAYAKFPVVSFDTAPKDWQVASSAMVSGSIVVSLDYFKRIIAGLRALIGGRVKTYEPLLERARREALLRMIESAKADGYDAVFNVRLETSRLANARSGGNGTAGVEMLAFGTAVKLQSRFARP